METLQRTANRGSISTGYDIDNSVKMEPDNGERFDTGDKFTNYSSVRKFTVSGWLKRTELSAQSIIWFNSNTATSVQLQFEAGDFLSILLQDNVGNGVESYAKTSALFRDTSAWYHVVLAVDTTDGTAANRTKIYVNGVNQTLVQGNGAYDTFPAQNYDVPLQTKHYLLGYDGGNNGFRGYAAEYYFLDGITASSTDFGEYDDDSGIWKPIEYTGSFGNEGYYLDFEDASALGKDVSSNNQGTFTFYGGSSADQATDTPTNNFCTLNPLFTGFNSSVQLPSNGATQYGLSGGNQDLSYAGTMGVTKGKWYFENYINEVGATYGARIYVGFHTFQQDYDGVPVGASTNGDALAVWQMDAGNYFAWNGGSRIITSGLGTVGSGGVGKFVGIALNLDDNQISFYYDGSAVTNGTNLPLYNMGSQTDDGIFAIPVVQSKGSVQTANFGGYIPSNFISSAASDANGYGTFEYAPPTGYYALCTKNLAEYG